MPIEEDDIRAVQREEQIKKKEKETDYIEAEGKGRDDSVVER